MSNGERNTPRANFTFSVTALIEGLYFGFGMIFLPVFFLELSYLTEPGILEINMFRTIGVLALALAIGCLVARNGDASAVRQMSLVMAMAKTGSTIILIIWIAGTQPQPIFYINPVLTAFLAAINIHLFSLTK
jgi:hypothetical protein